MSAIVRIDNIEGGLPASNGMSVAFSYDNKFMVVGDNNYSWTSIYVRDGDVFIRQPNASSFLETQTWSVAFSPDSQFMAMGLGGNPYLALFKVEGDNFIRQSNPTGGIPGNICRGVVFSPDNKFLAVAHQDSPYVSVYKRNGNSFSRLPNLTGGFPSGFGNGVAFSSNSNFMVVTVEQTNIFVIYKIDGDTFTRQTDPIGGFPTGQCQSASFSLDNKFLAVTSSGSPFVSVYKIEGDTFTKQPNPTGGLPEGNGLSVSFSSNDKFMAVALFVSPYITIYKRDGDTFTKQPNPTGGLPTGLSRGIAFSVDNVFLAVAHAVSPFITIYKFLPPVNISDVSLSFTTVSRENTILFGDIIADERISYRISVNDIFVFPDSIGSYTSYADSPVTVNYTVLNSTLNLGDNPVLLEVLTEDLEETSETYTVTKTNTTPTDTLSTDKTSQHGESITISGQITDADGDTIRYRILLDTDVLEDWTSLASSPVTIDYEIPFSTLGYSTKTVKVEYEDSFGASDYFEQIITYVNSNPVINLTPNNLGVIYNNFTLTGNITDVDNDNVRYRITIDGDTFLNWTPFMASGTTLNITIPPSAFTLGENTLIVYAEDTLDGTDSESFTVVKRDFEITYIDSENPTSNFLSDTQVLLSPTKYVLVKTGGIDPLLGYPDTTSLVLNMLVLASGDVKIAKVLSTWSPETVTYNTKPTLDEVNVFDITFTNTQTQTIDVSNLAGAYGIVLYTDSDSFTLDYLGHESIITYKDSVLYHPEVVFYDTTRLNWEKPIFGSSAIKEAAYYRLALQRAESSDFSDAIDVLVTEDLNTKTFRDDTIVKDKTYYYRLMFYFRSILDDGTKIDFSKDDESLYIKQDSDFITITLEDKAELVAGTVGAYYITTSNDIRLNTLDWEDITSVSIGQLVHDFLEEVFDIDFLTSESASYVFENALKIGLVDDTASLIDSGSGYPTDKGYYLITKPVILDRGSMTSVTTLDNTEVLNSLDYNPTIEVQGTLSDSSNYGYVPLNSYIFSIQIES